MIIPMIDIMFFLLVFFMMTSLSMVDLHSSVQLPRGFGCPGPAVGAVRRDLED